MKGEEGKMKEGRKEGEEKKVKKEKKAGREDGR